MATRRGGREIPINTSARRSPFRTFCYSHDAFIGGSHALGGKPAAHMKLVSIDAPPHGKTGALIGDEVLDFAAASTRIPMAAWVPADMRELLVAGEPALELVAGIVDRVRNASE